MPIYDYQCSKCGHTEERFESIGTTMVVCPRCKNLARRIVSTRSVNTANEDAPWIRSVIEVVDKDSKKPHVVEFLKNPTRTNYRRWMKGEGLRHLEPGEKDRKRNEEEHTHKVTENLLKRLYERRSIRI